MNFRSVFHHSGLLVLAGMACLAVRPAAADEPPKLRVLVLSGANNHNWRETTPAIKAALEESGRFQVDVEDNVPGMKPEAFAPYQVILGNFNTFGKDAAAVVWDAAMKKAFLDHLAHGHGLVIVHAGSSVFYDWPEFQKLACGSWKDGTSHGPIHVDKVTFTEEKSPITSGLQPFWIRDEFWQNTGLDPAAKTLATVLVVDSAKNSGKSHPLVCTSESAGARGFALFLGHDGAAMKNTAWRSLLQRGAEWAATGKVTLPPAKDWPTTKEDAERMAR